MDELVPYHGTHAGEIIDRDLDCIDAAFNEDFPNTDPSLATIPAFSRSKVSAVYSVVAQEFEFGAYPSWAIIPDNALITYDCAKAEVRKSRIAKVSFSGVSSLPQTFTEAAVSDSGKRILSEDCEVVRVELSNPGAQIGPWTVSLSDVSQTISGTTYVTTAVTISGAINGTTDVVLYLAEPLVVNQNIGH